MNYAVYCASATYGFSGFRFIEPSSEVSSYVPNHRSFLTEHSCWPDIFTKIQKFSSNEVRRIAKHRTNIGSTNKEYPQNPS